MAKREFLVRALGESELCLLEDAIAFYRSSSDDISEFSEEMLSVLADDIRYARRMRHQLGKTQR